MSPINTDSSMIYFTWIQQPWLGSNQKSRGRSPQHASARQGASLTRRSIILGAMMVCIGWMTSTFLILIPTIGKKYKLRTLSPGLAAGIPLILLRDNCTYLEEMTANYHSMIFGCCSLEYRCPNRAYQETCYQCSSRENSRTWLLL